MAKRDQGQEVTRVGAQQSMTQPEEEVRCLLKPSYEKMNKASPHYSLTININGDMLVVHENHMFADSLLINLLLFESPYQLVTL